jgi:hypothetical protein
MSRSSLAGTRWATGCILINSADPAQRHGQYGRRFKESFKITYRLKQTFMRHASGKLLQGVHAHCGQCLG